MFQCLLAALILTRFVIVHSATEDWNSPGCMKGRYSKLLETMPYMVYYCWQILYWKDSFYPNLYPIWLAKETFTISMICFFLLLLSMAILVTLWISNITISLFCLEFQVENVSCSRVYQDHIFIPAYFLHFTSSEYRTIESITITNAMKSSSGAMPAITFKIWVIYFCENEFPSISIGVVICWFPLYFISTNNISAIFSRNDEQ